MIPQLIGAHLKQVRKAHGLSQVAACEFIGVTQSALSRIEAGKQQLLASQWLTFIFNIGAKNDLAAVVKRGMRGKS